MKMRFFIAVFLLLTTTAFSQDATLNWNANPASDAVIGYRLYRGAAPRTYSTYANVGNLTSFTFSNLPNGTHYFAVTAFNTTGESGYSNEVSKSIGVPPPTSQPFASINFTSPSGSAVPGLLNDSGGLFNGTRGWNAQIESRERPAINPNPALNSFVFNALVGVSTPIVATWNYVVPNGNYLVTLECGDPAYAQGPHRVTIEEIREINDVYTAANQFAKITDRPVNVSDGNLTISIGGANGYTTLNYVIIKAGSTVAQTPANPTGLTVR